MWGELDHWCDIAAIFGGRGKSCNWNCGRVWGVAEERPSHPAAVPALERFPRQPAIFMGRLRREYEMNS
jgi:hypothetical protein